MTFQKKALRLNAYLLAADPTWIERSIPRFYPLVNRIIVSYDETNRGWTGSPVHVEECLRLLRGLDHESKMFFQPGNYSGGHGPPLESETNQRRIALAEASIDADWVLQLDPDEALADTAALLRVLSDVPAEIVGIEWPMRVLFRHAAGRWLEVRSESGGYHFDYPGCIAVRPNAELAHARQVAGKFLRVVVEGDKESLQVRRPKMENEERLVAALPKDVVLHNSWARSPAEVRSKVASWGHYDGYRTWYYYWTKWWVAPLLWRWQRNLHPFGDGLWPRLGIADDIDEVAPVPARSTVSENVRGRSAAAPDS